MKKLLLLVSILLTFSTVQGQTIEKELDSIQESVDLIRSLLDEETDDLGFKYSVENPTTLKFNWNSDEAVFLKSINDVRIEKGNGWMDYENLTGEPAESGVKWGGLQPDRTHYFTLEGVESDTLTYFYESDSEPEPEPEKTSKRFKVIETNNTIMHTPVPMGLIEHDGKYRLYFYDRRNNDMLYAESNDLEGWTSHKQSGLDVGSGANFIQDSDGNVYLYEGEGHELFMYDVKGSNLDRLENKRLAYTWRIDGKVTMSIHNGTWYSTGRVRGSAPKSEGGWGNDLPEYPDPDEFPYIKSEYAEHAPSWMDLSDLFNILKDRRGISLHTSQDGINWSSGEIIADPIDYNQKELRGWTVDGENGIADFYSSMMVDDRRMIVKLYKKEKNRVIDRWEYDSDMRIERRFRFTGETILVPAIFDGQNVTLTSTESIIPRKYHERKTPEAVKYYTCASCVDFGQTSNGNQVIFKDGYAYIFYGYRDDVHYEAIGYDYYTGIYVYRMPVEKFDNLFK